MTSAVEELENYPRPQYSADPYQSRLQPLRRKDVIRKVALAQKAVWASALVITPVAGGLCAVGGLLFRSSRFPSIKTGILIGLFLSLVAGMLKSQWDLAVGEKEAENKFRRFYNQRFTTHPEPGAERTGGALSMEERFDRLRYPELGVRTAY